jgi:hypothetical protein
MTEQTEATEAAAPVEMPAEKEIDFQGRKLWVRLPRPEALLVWKRTLAKLQNLDTGDWNGEQVMAALERTREIIDSLLVHEIDKDWLDDEMLASRLGLIETAQIINLTVEAYQADDNREARRAAKKAPAKKATRKKAAR